MASFNIMGSIGKTKNIVITRQIIDNILSYSDYKWGDTYDVSNIDSVTISNIAMRDGVAGRALNIYLDETLAYSSVVQGSILDIDTKNVQSLRITPTATSTWTAYMIIFSNVNKIKSETVTLSPSGSSTASWYSQVIDLTYINSLYVKLKPLPDSSTNRSIIIDIDGTTYTLAPNSERTFDVSNNSIAKIYSATNQVLKVYDVELTT